MSLLRFKMVEAAIDHKAVEVKAPEGSPSEYFGTKVFGREAMRRYLNKTVYAQLLDTMQRGTPLTLEVADGVAAGMRQWALDHGADHYTHWFQPLTGGTAEKHDAFAEPDGCGGVLDEFSGKVLVQQEPDASSFPNGGIRNTFEARGYSAWDPTSPAFIVGGTLCIPTVFIAYTGEALDYKVPLLRSISAVNKAATEVCRYFDKEVNRVIQYLGWEQEYFLVDESLWAVRPDLMLTGRTLMGHESAKNQQLEDHYFGAIPSRVEAFMQDLEIECHMLGIPVKTCHNEVAPNQFEVAPIFEETNLANDHNLLLMSVMREVARRHNFRVLLHEKPFKGVNGSGKHNNWSLGTDTGVLLFAPGKTQKENLQFITFIVNVMAAVYKYNGLLKASISSATNGHRLGANEAPPAIISIFMGKQISEVLEKLAESTSDDVLNMSGKLGLKLDVAQIPEILMDNTDRNRTSPFAFTGNKFEFRMVGSADSIASPNTTLNAIVAEAFCEAADLLEKADDFDIAVHDLIKKYLTEHQRIIFNGNGYSEEWVEEAARRGLPNIKSMVEASETLTTEKSIKLFEKFGIFTKAELESREEVLYETYSKTINIEALTMVDMAKKQYIPAVMEYTKTLADTVLAVKSAGADATVQTTALKSISEKLAEAQAAETSLEDKLAEAAGIEDPKKLAFFYKDVVHTAMDDLRAPVDALEMMVDKKVWPVPTYGDLIFEV